MAKLGGGLSDSGFPGQCAACGKKAYHVFGGFKTNEYNTCIVNNIKISDSCAKCFDQAGQFGADNCKSKCMLGWKGDSCLSCTANAQKQAIECAGVKVPSVKANNKRQLKTTGCTKDDEAAMAKLGGGKGDNGFPGQCAACGKKAYHIFGGFKADEYDQCMLKNIKISETCARCFVTVAQYGADNCKSKCLTGWSGDKCLSCTANASKEALECAGVKVPAA